MNRTVVSWSGGKDAAFALWTLTDPDYDLLADLSIEDGDAVEVVELLTTVNEQYDRSTMHGVRRSLYERQAKALGYPIRFVTLPAEPSNDEYESIMADITREYCERSVDRICFADLYLEDVRSYREKRFADVSIDGYWPIWGLDTRAVAETFLEAGFAATVVTVNGEILDESFAGRPFDAEFLADLPDDVDPCGENGEFHTFVHDGPIFETSVPVETGAIVTRSSGDTPFHYADLEYTGAN